MVSVVPTRNQIDDLRIRLDAVIARDERVLITTLTKRMAEDLTNFLAKAGYRVQYLHSDIDTIQRIEILRSLRLGEFDILVGINLLREGLDLPEVSLVAILDADKEGFLRSRSALIQTIGRAARNSNGEAVLYADRMTDSMREAISVTERRRLLQIEYNEEHGIEPQTIMKNVADILGRLRSESVPEPTNKVHGITSLGGDACPTTSTWRSLGWRRRCSAAAANCASKRPPPCATISTPCNVKALDFVARRAWPSMS